MEREVDGSTILPLEDHLPGMFLGTGLYAERLPWLLLVPRVAPTHVGETLKANLGPLQSNLLAFSSVSGTWLHSQPAKRKTLSHISLQ